MYPVVPGVARRVFPDSRIIGLSKACRVVVTGTEALVIREYPVLPFTTSRVTVVPFVLFVLLKFTEFTIAVPATPL
jgi:hypothetical protein